MGAGYEVSLAEDSLEAMNLAIAESPELVLIADSIASTSGLALVGRLFSSAETAEIPVLVVADEEATRVAADRAGARAVIAGPVAAPDLLAAIAAGISAPGALSQAPDSVLSDAERLAAVDALRPGGTERESLDRFTALASEMLNVPVSTITLIDRDRQVFASQVGVAEPWASRGETPLDYSYCQYAVTSREPLRIDDASRHPLVRDSPARTEMQVVSYLGIPIITADDQAIGTLCAIDSQPREWTDREVGILNTLAGILTDHFNTVRGNRGRHSAGSARSELRP
jgi:CheY-like chemotaxis protein